MSRAPRNRLWRAARRLLLWTLLPVLGLVGASAAAYGLGFAVYASRGMPGHWRGVEASQASMRFLLMANPMAQSSALYARLGVGGSEDSFIRMAQNGRWFPEAPGVLRRMDDDFMATYRLDATGRVSRVHIVIPGVESIRARDANARMMQMWGFATLEGGAIPASPATAQALDYSVDGARVLVEYQPEEIEGLWTMRVTLLAPSDPAFSAFPETGGLPPGHPLAKQMASPAAAAAGPRALAPRLKGEAKPAPSLAPRRLPGSDAAPAPRGSTPAR